MKAFWRRILQGAKGALRQNTNYVVKEIAAMGGVEALLDQTGREMLTVWIPLDHHLTDDDSKRARRLGESLCQHVSRDVASFAAVETGLDEVGVLVIGRDVETMVEQIRPYMKQHCPKGTYIGRKTVTRDDVVFDRQRIPLFENNDIPVENSPSEPPL